MCPNACHFSRVGIFYGPRAQLASPASGPRTYTFVIQVSCGLAATLLHGTAYLGLRLPVFARSCPSRRTNLSDGKSCIEHDRTDRMSRRRTPAEAGRSNARFTTRQQRSSGTLKTILQAILRFEAVSSTHAALDDRRDLRRRCVTDCSACLLPCQHSRETHPAFTLGAASRGCWRVTTSMKMYQVRFGSGGLVYMRIRMAA